MSFLNKKDTHQSVNIDDEIFQQFSLERWSQNKFRDRECIQLKMMKKKKETKIAERKLILHTYSNKMHNFIRDSTLDLCHGARFNELMKLQGYFNAILP